MLREKYQSFLHETMSKPRIKIQSGSHLMKGLSYPATPNVSEIAESATKITAAVAALSLLVSLVFGAAFSLVDSAEFGIPFFEIADTEDYVRATLSKLMLVSLSFCVITILLFLVKHAKAFKRSKAKWFSGAGALVFFDAVVSLILIVGLILISYMKFNALDVRGQPLSDEKTQSYQGTNHGIRVGHNGIWTIEYGKDYKRKECLSFIAMVGGQHYYWSVQNKRLFSVSALQIVSSTRVLDSKPRQNSKAAIAWHKQRQALCPISSVIHE
tara:strand:- start:5554 stop:6363 length:810 start_codon:yes stop_codon:yes gene_type:complete